MLHTKEELLTVSSTVTLLHIDCEFDFDYKEFFFDLDDWTKRYPEFSVNFKHLTPCNIREACVISNRKLLTADMC